MCHLTQDSTDHNFCYSSYGALAKRRNSPISIGVDRQLTAPMDTTSDLEASCSSVVEHQLMM